MVLAAAANIYSLSILYVLSNVIFIAVVLKVLLVGFVFFFIHWWCTEFQPIAQGPTAGKCKSWGSDLSDKKTVRKCK